MQTRIRRGFTLVELLVVIAIIGILVAMILPAVQSAREAARRTQCASNAKQLATALLTYHNLNSTFPPSSTWPGNPNWPNPGNPGFYSSVIGNSAGVSGPNWAVLILPQMDETSLYRSFNIIPGTPTYVTKFPIGIATSLPTMTCPSDTYSRSAYVDGAGNTWVRGNYGVNGGLNIVSSSGSPNWQQSTNTLGVMGLDIALTLDQIKDGASNTLLLAELRSGLNSSDPRGVWAMGGTPSSLWGHGSQVNLSDNGPNCLLAGGGDQMATCTQLQSQFSGGSVGMVNVGMPCSPGSPDANNVQTSRSMHLGGIQAAFCDGSVHFISNYIQLGPVTAAVNPTTTSTYGVWDLLNLSNDGQAVPAGSY